MGVPVKARASTADKVTPTVATHNGRVSVRQPRPARRGNHTGNDTAGVDTPPASALRHDPCLPEITMSTKPVAEQVVPGEAGAESATAARGAARPRESWFRLCGTADAIRQESKAEEKRSLLEPYLLALDAHTIGPAARILAGVVRPDGDATPLAISRTLIVGVIRSVTRTSAERLLELAMKLGDLGDAAGEVFSGRLPSGVAVVEMEQRLRELAAAESDESRVPLLREMLAKMSGIEAQYLVRITDRGLAVGLDPSLVEHAIANAFNEPLDLVRAAVARHRDIGLVAERARRRALAD